MTDSIFELVLIGMHVGISVPSHIAPAMDAVHTESFGDCIPYG